MNIRLLNALKISHLRDGTEVRDQAIMDSLYLIECGYIPRTQTTQELEEQWSCSQSNVSRRLDRVNKVELLRIHGMYRGYELQWGREFIRQLQQYEKQQLRQYE